MDNPLISIIIPVYNAEKYLHQCLDSVVAQTYTNWECLLIDDGSKDSSGVICDEYAAKDSRFRVFHKENGGVSSARNLGIKEAEGEFIAFYDSDDTIPADSIKVLYSSLCNSNSDSVVGNYKKIYCEEKILCSNIFKEFSKRQVEDTLRLFFVYPRELFQGYLWNRLFRRKIIADNDIRFNESIKYKEDGLFLVSYILKSGNPIVCVPNIVYNYYVRTNSAMGILNKSFSKDYFTNLDARLLILKEIKESKRSKEIVDLAKDSVGDIVKILLQKMRRFHQFNVKNIAYIVVRLVKNMIFFSTLFYLFKWLIKR